MSDELGRLKADLEVLERYNQSIYLDDIKRGIREKIANLEAAAADPWREAKVAVERFQKSPNHRSEVVVGEYIDHLTAKVEAQKKQIDYLHAEYENRGLHISELVADNDRLEKRVAELEAEDAADVADDPRVLRRAILLMERSWLQGLGLRNTKHYIEKARKELESEESRTREPEK